MGRKKQKDLFGLLRTGLSCAVLFMLVACSDDASSTGADELSESSSSISDQLADSGLGVESSSSNIWYQPFDTTVTVPVIRDTLPAADSLKDTLPVAPEKKVYSIRHLAVDSRMAPLFGVPADAVVKVEALDGENGFAVIHADSANVDGVDFEPLSVESPYVKVSVNGVSLAFPGATQLVAGLTLSAFDDLTSKDSIDVNFLSSAKFPRIQMLLAAGQTPAVAMEQAETEILRAFHMDEFAEKSKDEEAARLLAIHLLASSRVAEGDGFTFDSIANDIADDGLWNDSASRAKIAEWALNADASDGFAAIRNELSAAAVLDVSGFEKYLRRFYQQELGLPECSSENVGTILHVNNTASSYFVLEDADYSVVSERFTCKASDEIAFASDSLKDTYGFGLGKVGEVRVGAFSGNVYYTFDIKIGAWRHSTAVEKDSYFVKLSETSTFVDIQDVYEGIKPNERVIFVLRHAERGDDTSKSGSLTSNGKTQSQGVGERLKFFSEDFLLGGSEFLRAHQTVEYIARGRGQQYDVRDTFPELNDDWYVKNKEASSQASSECGGGWQSTSKYAYTGAYTTGDDAAFYKLDERSVELIEDVLLAKYSDPSHRFVILSSHDKVMVPLVAYCTNFKVNLKKYDGGKWLNYLAGIAIIIDELGNRRYVPVKGLESAYM